MRLRASRMAGLAEGRGPSRVLLFGTLSFIGIAVYVLVITHHLRIDSHGLHLQSSRSSLQSSGLNQVKKRPPVDTAAAMAFVQRMEHLAVMTRYDKNKDGVLSGDEFNKFLLDLARSRIIDPQVMGNVYGLGADLIVQAGPGKANSSSRQQQQQRQQLSQANELGEHVSHAQIIARGVQCPELSRELVESFAVNNTIMLTVSDWKIFETMGVNWMRHLNKYNVSYYIVGATDKQTSLFLGGQKGRHPCFKFFEDGHGQGTSHEYKYGSAHYNAATWRKVAVVAQIVNWGFNVIHSDVDVIWFRDPLPYFLGPPLQYADVAVSTDLISTHLPPGDEGLEVDIHLSVNVNTGVYFVKSSPGGKSFMTAWSDLRTVMQHDNDQIGLYKFLRSRQAHHDHEKRYLEIKADNSQTPIRLGMLGSHMLLNGYSYFIPKLNVHKKVNALGIHMTWVPLSREGKFHRMRDGMLYDDAPAYYTEPSFITADIDFPEAPPGYNQEKDTEAMIKFHLKAMDQQLVQVYRVMAMSVILNRTLVLPKLKCFCYKNWFMMEQCRIPGDRTTQFPLDCELDQWLRPKVIYNYGPNIKGAAGNQSFLFREHTLFTNPNFPPSLLTDQVVVTPGAPGSQPELSTKDVRSLDMPVPGLTQGSIQVLHLPPLMKENALRQTINKMVGKVKIIRLRMPYDLFGGWDDKQLQDSFEVFLDKVAGNWCCRDQPFIAAGMKEKEKLAIHW